MKIPTAALALIAMTSVVACKDETVSGYAQDNVEWVLTELDGKAFPARATIEFPEQGKVAGKAPCNRYFADQRVPYPWFEVGPIGSTKMACKDMAAEAEFFAALSEMGLSEAVGDTLILSNDAGRQMVFTAQKKPE